MILFKCPNCRLCTDLEFHFKNKLCPMCGNPKDKLTDKKICNSAESCK